MDPSIWGPKLWNVIFDLCHGLDGEHSETQKQAVMLVFGALRDLLPCRYCRDSYRGYVQDLPMDAYFSSHKCLEWAYTLKNKVNAKLDKRDSISYEKFERRMATWTTASSNSDVFDVLYILALNWTPRAFSPEQRAQKKYALFVLLNALPVALELLPNRQKTIAALAAAQDLTAEDLKSQQALLAWLCGAAAKCNGPCRSVPDAKKKYGHCKAVPK